MSKVRWVSLIAAWSYLALANAAELPADLAQVAFASGLVLHDRSATDHFQVRDLREVG